jgi:Putative Ig domain
MDYTQRCNAARLLRRSPHFLLFVAMAVVLSACGGGDGTSTDGSTASTSSTDTTPPTASDTAVTAPTISGTPATTATAGTSYSFQPTVSSSNSGTLTYSITNKPAWATFSSSTGQLAGTPGSGDVGTDVGVVISVAQGSASASLAAFTISVAAAAPTQGNATLSWTAPVQNTDGSSITNLSGYVISYGTSPGALSQTVTVSDPSATSYTIQSLVAGTWYFAVSAVETSGASSALSSTVSTTIQ